MVDKWLELIEKKKEHPFTLIIGIVALIIIFTSVDALIKQPTNYLLKIAIYFPLILFWIIYWLVVRIKLPKITENKVGIILCINTETESQKVRLTKDFYDKIDSIIHVHKLTNDLEVILLNEYHSRRIAKILKAYSKIEKNNSNLSKSQLATFKQFNKLHKKLRGQFYIFGELKERQDKNENYFFNLDGIFIHRRVSDEIQEKLQNEINLVWARNIQFEKSIELKGFEYSAELVLINSEYLVGIALLISGFIESALKLHLNLEAGLKKIANPPTHIKRMLNELSKVLIVEEYAILAKYYLFQNDRKNCKDCIEKTLLRDNQNYSALISKCYYEFKFENNIPKALKTIDIAKNVLKKDCIWRYNKAFLLMYLKKYQQAYKLYEEIIGQEYSKEYITLNEVIEFNESYVKSFPSFCQSYFILGILYLKKIQNYPKAYENFTTFKKSQCYRSSDFLKQITDNFLEEIKLYMNID